MSVRPALPPARSLAKWAFSRESANFAVRDPRQVAVLAGASIVAVASTYVLVHKSVTAAAALVLLPFVIWIIVRPSGGLAVGLVLILIAPYWWTLGNGQATVIRVAVLSAAISAFVSRRVRLRLSFIDCGLLVYVAVVVLGWLLQNDQPGASHIVISGLAPVAFYVGARVVPRARIPHFMRLMLFAGTFGALTVLYEFVRGHEVYVDPTKYVWNPAPGSIFRPGGIFGSPPAAATVLVFIFFFGLAAVANARGRARALAVSCVGICTLALISTFTRGNLIGAGIGLIVFLWLVRSPLLRPTRVAAFLAVLGIAIIVALPTLQANSTFREAIVRPGNLTARESYWKLALPIATSNAHNFVFGVGTAALETPWISDRAVLPAAVATAPQIVQIELHNQYVTTFVEQGLVGVTALIAVLLSGFVAACRAARAKGDAVHAALAASIVALAVDLTVNTAFNTGPSFAMLLVALGFTAAAPLGRA